MDSLPLLKPVEVWFLLLTTENPGKHFSPGCGPVLKERLFVEIPITPCAHQSTSLCLSRANL